MDYDKNLVTYQKLNMVKKWEDMPERNRHNKEKMWYDKVKSKRTGEYFQESEILIKREQG